MSQGAPVSPIPELVHNLASALALRAPMMQQVSYVVVN